MQSEIFKNLEIITGKKPRTENNGKTLKVNIEELEMGQIFSFGLMLNVKVKEIKKFRVKRSGKGLVIITELI